MSEPQRPGAQQYFTAHPQSPSRPTTITLSLPDTHFTLETDRGVFSGGQVDTGTRLLLLEAPSPPQGEVNLADVGCGYGPIALTLAQRSPQATIWAVDVNERALELCRRNAEAAGLADRIRVCTPPEVPEGLQVDGFWSNPPIRVGKSVLHELLGGWFDRLVPAASALLVVQKHLGADSLATWCSSRGLRTERLLSRAGYRLLSVTAPAENTQEAESEDQP